MTAKQENTVRQLEAEGWKCSDADPQFITNPKQAMSKPGTWRVYVGSAGEVYRRLRSDDTGAMCYVRIKKSEVISGSLRVGEEGEQNG